jgi:hypothetical protein
VIVNAVLAILTRSESTLPQTHSVLIPDAVVTVPKMAVDRITGGDQRAFLRVETSDPTSANGFKQKPTSAPSRLLSWRVWVSASDVASAKAGGLRSDWL